MPRYSRALLAIAVLLITGENAAAQPPTTSGWRIEFAESGSDPVLVDGVLYVGSADGALYAFDAGTGQIKWRFQTGASLSASTSGPQIVTVPRGAGIADQIAAGIGAVERQQREGKRTIDMTPAVANGTVFVGSGDRSFYAVDAATGAQQWSYLAGAGMASGNSSNSPAPLLDNGSVYVVTEDGLHALDALTGEKRWVFETLQEIPLEQMNLGRKRKPSGPVSGDGVLLLTTWPYARSDTPPKSFVYAVDRDSGKARWVTSVDGLWISAPSTAQGLVFFTVRENTELAAPSRGVTLYALDAADGQVEWKLAAAESADTFVSETYTLISGSTIYFSTETRLAALELKTGRQLWAEEIGGELAADDMRLYVVSHGPKLASKETLHALDFGTGQEMWSRTLAANFAEIQDGVIYSDSARIQAMLAATGKDLWTFKGTGRESIRLIAGGRIFLTSPTVTYFGTNRVDQGYLSALDAKTGKLSSR